MIVYVVGVPGVGKTSVINEAKKYFKKEYYIVNVGDIMENFLKDVVKNRDEIRKKLSVSESEELQIKTFEYIKENYNGKNIILDTHFIIETSNGFKAGILKKLTEILKPDAISVIIADPYEIFKRRILDKSRERDIDDIRIIEIQQNLTIYYSIQMMYEYDSILKVIINKENLLDMAAKEFAEFINNL